MRQAFIHRLGASAPDDVAPARGSPSPTAGSLPAAIVAVLGKTEGNGCVNDFSRGFATACPAPPARAHLPADIGGGPARHVGRHRGRARTALARARGAARTGGVGPALASGGPHAPTRAGGDRPGGADRGAAEAVRDRDGPGRDRGIRDVHYVQVKCPLLTAERIARCARCRPRGRDPGHATSRWAVARCLGARRGAAPWARSPRQRIGDRGRRRLVLWSGRACPRPGSSSGQRGRGARNVARLDRRPA